MAEDTAALLEALDVPQAHVVGWSLGSAIAQELALAHPEQVASAVMYATWGRCNGFQRSVLTALRLPYAVRDMDAALAAAGLAFSPQLLDHPDLDADDRADAARRSRRTRSRCRSPSSSGTPTWCTTRSTGSAASPRRRWWWSASRTC